MPRAAKEQGTLEVFEKTGGTRVRIGGTSVKTGGISEKIAETFAETGESCGTTFNPEQALDKSPRTVMIFDKTGAISKMTTGIFDMIGKTGAKTGAICGTIWLGAKAADAKSASERKSRQELRLLSALS
ncbi:MAG: hypothetical protein HY038_04255 [Nitrospirae bacterium]|nr:hypothetical protein [Nitrospirota bacterium]